MQNAPLNAVRARGYCCFPELSVVPGQVNLLIGESGSGKTAFLGIINGIASFVGRGALLSAAFPIPPGIRGSVTESWAPSETELSLAFVLENESFGYTLRFRKEATSAGILPRVVNRLSGEELICHLWKGHPNGRVLYDVKETKGGRTSRVMVNGRRRRIFVAHDAPYRKDVCEFPACNNARTCPELNRVHRFFWQGVRVACPEHITKSYTRALAREMVDPLGIQPEPRVLLSLPERFPPEVVTAWKEYVQEVGAEISSSFGPLTAGALSTGQHELGYLRSLIPGGSRGDWKVLLLDNPATCMSPADVHAWLTDLTGAMRPENQVFIATHNPEIINYLAADDPEVKVFLFERKAGTVQVGEAVFDRECGLSAAEQLARGQVKMKDGKE